MILLAISLTIAYSAPVGAQRATKIPALRAQQWREDLRFFATELVRRHRNAYHLVSKEDLDRAVAELDARVPSLRDHEVVVGMQRLAAMIGDGHTFLGTGDLYHSRRGADRRAEFTLPNSRLRAFCAILHYRFDREEVTAVMPDKRIDPDWTAYRAGRDPVMEWILAQP